MEKVCPGRGSASFDPCCLGGAVRHWASAVMFLKTARPQISPHVEDVLQALALVPALARSGPAGGNVPIRRPNRILAFVIDDDLVAGGVWPTAIGRFPGIHGVRFRGRSHSAAPRDNRPGQLQTGT